MTDVTERARQALADWYAYERSPDTTLVSPPPEHVLVELVAEQRACIEELRDMLRDEPYLSDQLREARRERDEAVAAIGRVQVLHGLRQVGFPRATTRERFCTSCQEWVPCPTLRALDGEETQ